MLYKAKVLSFPGRRGFTIVEIIMACIIIGILTLVLVPVLTRQANDARLNTARQELVNLANAEERVCVDTGFLVRPYVLNDVRGGDGIANVPVNWPVLPTDPIDRIQGFCDNVSGIAGSGGTGVYQNPSYIFISPKTQDYVPTQQQDSIMRRMIGDLSGDPLKEELVKEDYRWPGPYIHWKRDVNGDDWPDDPWGNNYILFTKVGMICPPLVRPTNGSSGGSGGSGGTGGSGSGSSNTQDLSYPIVAPNTPQIDVNGTQYSFPTEEIFDRPTWVSLGPDGIPGSISKATGQIDTNDVTTYGFGKGDDLVYSFGGS